MKRLRLDLTTAIALALVMLALIVLTGCGNDPGPQQSDEDYCATTYVSTWDGRQVKPLGCPE